MSGDPSSSSEDTYTPVSNVAPYSSSSEIIAPLIAAEPPSATGQPKRCAAVPRVTPIADDIGERNGRKACAATPANSARASGVENRRASTAAGSPETAPKRASASGCAGHVQHRPQEVLRDRVEALGERAEQRLPATAVGPQRRGGPLDRAVGRGAGRRRRADGRTAPRASGT